MPVNQPVDRFLEQSAALLRGRKLSLREGESINLSALAIAGIISGCVVVLILLWVLYRYMIWKPRMKARRAEGLPTSPTTKTGNETTSSNEASADEAKRLFAAIKAK